MKVLVINCGSSSLKYQLIDSETESVLAKGLCERIGIDGALTHQPAGKDKIKSTPAMPDHKTAIGIGPHSATSTFQILCAEVREGLCSSTDYPKCRSAMSLLRMS